MDRRSFLKGIVSFGTVAAVGLPVLSDDRWPIEAAFYLDPLSGDIRYIGRDQDTYTAFEFFQYVSDLPLLDTPYKIDFPIGSPA